MNEASLLFWWFFPPSLPVVFPESSLDFLLTTLFHLPSAESCASHIVSTEIKYDAWSEVDPLQSLTALFGDENEMVVVQKRLCGLRGALVCQFIQTELYICLWYKLKEINNGDTHVLVGLVKESLPHVWCVIHTYIYTFYRACVRMDLRVVFKTLVGMEKSFSIHDSSTFHYMMLYNSRYYTLREI